MVRATKDIVGDLVIGFGFSKTNAHTALSEYYHDSDFLTDDEAACMNYIVHTNVFEVRGRMNIKDRYISVLEHLNYRITESDVR